MEATEREWIVDGLKIAGLHWQGRGRRRILALHGWLDHAGSFAVLAPLLDAEIVVLDLTGHGHSDHRSRDATYSIWDDIPQILGVLDELGWSNVTLLGHSRGAMISLLIAALRPERVEAVVALDALMPAPVAEEKVVEQMRDFLHDTMRAKRNRKSYFSSPDGFVQRRQLRGLAPEIGRRLMDRAIMADGDGYRVRADPRLHAASVMKLTAGQIDAIFRAIEAPALAIWAGDGLGNKDWARAHRQRFAELNAGYRELTVPGHHHWHLDDFAAPVIAAHINHFLRKLPESLSEA